MAWFKVDDGFATSPKVLSIPRAQRLAAVGLWTIAGTWCAKHLTDGAVPAFMLDEWGADVSHGTALVEAGLWRSTAKGYQFHAWAEYQPSRAEVEGVREKERQRKQAYRDKKAGQPMNGPVGTDAGVPTGQTEVSQGASGHPDPTRPDPTHPVPKGTQRRAADRGTRLPDSWSPSPLLLQYAKTKAPSVDIETETEKFCNYWLAKAGAAARKTSWDRTWQNWMLEQHQRNVQRGWVSQSQRVLSVDEIEARRREVESHVG